MGLSINNLPGLQAGNQAARSNNLLAKSLERLAAASRIRKAADDASGLAIAERFNSVVRQGRVEINNLQYGLSAAQTAEGGIEVQQQATQRLRELSLQAANGTLTDGQRAALNTEAQQLLEQIGSIADSTSFNDQNLLNQNGSIELGTEGNIRLNLTASNTTSLGLDGLDLSTAEGAAQALASVDSALNDLSRNRSNLGAQVNRFGAAINQRETRVSNAAEAESRIRDLDIAQESIERARAQVLRESAFAGILQANVSSQSVLRLL